MTDIDPDVDVTMMGPAVDVTDVDVTVIGPDVVTMTSVYPTLWACSANT